MECIILAGGLGTRLQGVIGAYPKCMAEVNGKPFLHYIFSYLATQDCRRVILSLGFKHEIIVNWLDGHDWPFHIDYVIEQQPLGTGGGIQLAMREATDKNVMVLNGDTMFHVDLKAMLAFHEEKNSATTLALKEMYNFNRYGVVETDANDCVVAFKEKQFQEKGFINGGIYAINKEAFFAKELPEHFSFEQHYLELFVKEQQFYGFKSDGYFIDIGIPEDYQRAQTDFTTIF